MHPGFGRFVALWIAVFSLAGCSDYMRRWDRPLGNTKGPDPFEGSYVGTWESSQYKGTSGKLWCILKRVGPDHYKAQFRATWHGVFSSEHSVILQVRDRKRVGARLVAKFTGDTVIHMWIGSGRYQCVGELSPGHLEADYNSSYDRGKFRLRLVKPAAVPKVRAGTAFQ
jgi:hypothetical protein